MICHKHKFIFIHIPKTGGTSIESLFIKDADIKDVPKKHHTVHDINGELLKKYYAFTFVRNPWDRMVSYYKFRIKRSFAMFNHGGSFQEWIRFLCSDDVQKIKPYHFHLAIMNQYQFLVSKSNEIPLDFIGKFENLQQDFNIICDKIGIPKQQLPHKNTTEHKHYTEYYDDETREMVAEKYKKDIEYFGYEFGD
mgnify:CR=1 FL=1